MGALIDSSVLIACERGAIDLDGILNEHRETQFALSAITASELLHGVHRARSEARRGRREAFVEALLSSLPVISFETSSPPGFTRAYGLSSLPKESPSGSTIW